MERPVCSSHAAVMIYDDQARKWLPAEGITGVARVQIYQHQQNNTYRVVGRIVLDNTVVINSSILKGLKYNQATPTFHQWRDSRHVYGLNFQSANDADDFATAMMGALETLQAAAPPPRPQQIAPPLPPSSQNGPSQNDRLYNQQHQQDTNRRSGGLDNNSMPATRPSPPEPPGPPAVSRPPPAAPPAPPQPPAAPAAPPVPAPPAPPAAPAAPPVPAVPAAPPAPPAPPVAGGGGPPPPPPPPIGGPAAPSGGGGGGSGGGSGGGGTAGGLAAALAGAKLKKVVRTENNDGGGGGSSRPPPAGGGGGGDFMSSLQQKLNKRRQASENPSSDSSIKPSGRTSPPGAPKATTKPWERKPNGVDSTTTSASPQLNRPPPVSNRNSVDGVRIMRPPSGVDQHQSNTPTSPGFSGGRRPSQPAVNGNGGSENSLDYEKLKQEILTEMRKELQKTKTEIIDAIKLELSRR